MKRILKPYFFISLCGLLAFAPVSFMLRALKNDVVALEYPINHFISQCIRHGEMPYWFNTWGLGFPLHSNLTWGIYSTPQLAFGTIFNYDIYALHIEFIFFVLLSGWSMFYFLRHFILKNETIAQLLATCYMLSGFITGSSQWLLYITAAAFIPLLLASLLKLLQAPSFSNALQAAICYTLMFTSVYAAFNIITTYSLLLFILIYFLGSGKEKKGNAARARYLLLSAGMTILFCFPCLYFTLELLNHMSRGAGIATQSSFFNSNYLHPGALSSMLFPFYSVRMRFPNTEGTMLHSYAGLFVLLLTPTAILQAVKEKNRSTLLMLAAALLFLILSFGAITPVRQALNILPGFSYFRNPAIFRFYFIASLILFLAMVLRKQSFEELFDQKNFPPARFIRYTIWLLAGICLFVFLWNIGTPGGFSFGSIPGFIKSTGPSQTLLLSSLVQLILIVFLLLLIKTKKWKLATLLFSADLVINTLLCTPFFTVSSYSLAEVNRILHPVNGFPAQERKPAEVNATFTDQKGNDWQNVNIFSKEVSSRESYRGPLLLKNAEASDNKLTGLNQPLLFAGNDSTGNGVRVLLQRPTHIRAKANLTSPGTITLLQNYYPGWKAFVNDKKTEITPDKGPGMTIAVPQGEITIDFIYERKWIGISALLLHLVVISFCAMKLVSSIKRRSTRSSSPS